MSRSPRHKHGRYLLDKAFIYAPKVKRKWSADRELLESMQAATARPDRCVGGEAEWDEVDAMLRSRGDD